MACYHAAATAVTRNRDDVSADEMIAVFALDLNTLPRIDGVKHLRVPGSTSAYLCSQAGSPAAQIATAAVLAVAIAVCHVAVATAKGHPAA